MAPGADDRIGIVGLGHAVPDTVRGNDDPLFGGGGDALARELFVGFAARRVLAPGERVEDLGVLAAQRALADAGLGPSEVDRLYGAVSPGATLLPSGLFAVHEGLGLRRDAKVVPIQSEFTNFVDALGCACDAVAAGRCARVLVVVAAGWSRLVDYADAGAAGIGDGAGAVVVGRGARLAFVADVTETHGQWHAAMTVQVGTPRRSSPGAGVGPRPLFVFGADGARAFREFALSAPVRLVRRLLGEHGLAPGEVTLVAHQASASLLEAWQHELGVAALPSVLSELGNSTLATSAITLARTAPALATPYVVVLGMGLGQNFSAVLLRAR